MKINKKSSYAALTRDLRALRAQSDAPFLDAQLLLMGVTGLTRAQLMASPAACLSEAEQLRLDALIDAFSSGVPMAYILGVQEFWSLPLKVSRAVLIPRPETECLVEYILSVFSGSVPKKILDLGTGSGAIALALKKERPGFSVIASDVSESALAVARENAKHLDLSVTFVQGAWFEPLENQTFDCIVSNPPYISTQDPHLPALEYEPDLALTSGVGGLDDMIAIIDKVCDYLAVDGLLVLEHGFEQQAEVCQLLEVSGLKDITQHADLSGLPRFVSARKG